MSIGVFSEVPSMPIDENQLQQSQEMIQAMKTRKFWQLRTTWFKLKQAFGLDID